MSKYKMSLLDNGTKANPSVLYYSGGGGGGGVVSTFATASVGALTVSSINGEAQWFSTTTGVSLPATASTIIMQIPGNGSFNYSVTALSTANAWINVGMGSQGFVNPAYFGAVGADVAAGAATASPLVPFVSSPQTSGPIWLGVSNPTPGDITLAAASVASTAA